MITIKAEIQAGKFTSKKSGKDYYGAYISTENGFRKIVSFDINEISRLCGLSVLDFINECENNKQ